MDLVQENVGRAGILEILRGEQREGGKDLVFPEKVQKVPLRLGGPGRHGDEGVQLLRAQGQKLRREEGKKQLLARIIKRLVIGVKACQLPMHRLKVEAADGLQSDLSAVEMGVKIVGQLVDEGLVGVDVGAGIPAAVKAIGADGHLIVVDAQGMLEDADLLLRDEGDAHRGGVHEQKRELKHAQPLLLGGGGGLKDFDDAEFFRVGVFLKPLFIIAAVDVQIFIGLVAIKAQGAAVLRPVFHEAQHPGKGLLAPHPAKTMGFGQTVGIQRGDLPLLIGGVGAFAGGFARL